LEKSEKAEGILALSFDQICDKCHAGVMEDYERVMVNRGKEVRIKGAKCNRCGWIRMNDDGDVWPIVGL